MLIDANVGYIVMRLADKGDLDGHLGTGLFFQEHEVADVMLDVFTGLQILHDDLGIAHLGMFSPSFILPSLTSDNSLLIFLLIERSLFFISLHFLFCFLDVPDIWYEQTSNRKTSSSAPLAPAVPAPSSVTSGSRSR